MEIHHSSLNYVPRDKAPQLDEKSARADEKTFETKSKNDDHTTLDTEPSKTGLTPPNTEHFFKLPITKPVLSSFENTTIPNRPVNSYIQKAINAYSTELHQLARKESIQIDTGIDYFV